MAAAWGEMSQSKSGRLKKKMSLEPVNMFIYMAEGTLPTWLRLLRWKNYPGLCGWAQCKDKSLYEIGIQEGDVRMEAEVRERETDRRTGEKAVGFVQGGGGYKPRKAGVL